MSLPPLAREPRVVRLGAVGYLNARPLVFGLERSPHFAVRYDVPSECARLLHAGAVDLGLIPSIEYLQDDAYRIVPDLAIVSRGEVASVALFTTRPIGEVRSIAMDSSSRTSVALVRILCARLFRIQPAIDSLDPDLDVMLGRSDAALIIGDNALLWAGRQPHSSLLAGPHPRSRALGGTADAALPSGASREPQALHQPPVEKIDLGEAWTKMTGLPFVWAFWVGRAGELTGDDVRLLQEARDGGVREPEAVARAYFTDAPQHQALGARYLRHNISYYLRDEERAGLDAFYRYAHEVGVAPAPRELRFY